MFKYLPLLAVLSFCVFSCLDKAEDLKLTPHPYTIGYDTPYIDTLMIKDYEKIGGKYKYIIAYKKNKKTFERIKEMHGFDNDNVYLMATRMRVHRHPTRTYTVEERTIRLEKLSDAFDQLPSLDGEWHYEGWRGLVPGREYCYEIFFRDHRDIGPNEDSYKKVEFCHVFEH